MSSEATPILTVGHSSRPIGLLLQKLKAHRIRILVDVRRHPSSRRYPQYNRPALAVSLQEEGIAYVHEIDLGGLREPVEGSPHRALEGGDRGYADHMGTPAFREAVDRVATAARKVPLAILCAEADPAHCHRLYLSDALTVDGFEVVHLLQSGERRIHRLTPEARVLDGSLVYAARSERPISL